MEEKKWNAGSIGLTFAGSFLGAGYVSGQELWQFFGSFGGGGLLGVLAAMALLAVFGLALMYIISRTGIAEMDAVLVPWERLACTPAAARCSSSFSRCRRGSAGR